MKRWLLYLSAIAVLALLPEGQGTDVGKLQPVELIYIYKEADRITVQTDTGDTGTGNTLEKALDDMHEAAAGEIFLETVDYLLVTEDTKESIMGLQDVLRPSTRILLATGEVDPQDAAKYLAIHKPSLAMKDYLAGDRYLPKLMIAEERYYLEQNE